MGPDPPRQRCSAPLPPWPRLTPKPKPKPKPKLLLALEAGTEAGKAELGSEPAMNGSLVLLSMVVVNDGSDVAAVVIVFAAC